MVIYNLQLLLLNCILYIYFIIYFNMHNLLLLHFIVSKYSFVRIHIFSFFLINGMLCLEMCMCVQY